VCCHDLGEHRLRRAARGRATSASATTKRWLHATATSAATAKRWLPTAAAATASAAKRRLSATTATAAATAERRLPAASAASAPINQRAPHAAELTACQLRPIQRHRHAGRRLRPGLILISTRAPSSGRLNLNPNQFR